MIRELQALGHQDDLESGGCRLSKNLQQVVMGNRVILQSFTTFLFNFHRGTAQRKWGLRVCPNSWCPVCGRYQWIYVFNRIYCRMTMNETVFGHFLNRVRGGDSQGQAGSTARERPVQVYIIESQLGINATVSTFAET